MNPLRGLLKSFVIFELTALMPMLMFWNRHPKKRTRPYIVILLTDDIGFNDVPWDNPDLNAPNLLKLALESTILFLLTFLVNTYSCGAPSRASLLTGISRERHRMSTLKVMSPSRLTVEMPLMPEYLKAGGLHTSGRKCSWHLGYCSEEYLPTRRGFDTFFGSYNAFTGRYRHRAKSLYDFLENENLYFKAKGISKEVLGCKYALAYLRNTFYHSQNGY